MIGTNLGHYRVLKKIGEGGMGEVYRARDTKLGRDVAIKVIGEEFGRDRDRLDRFEREARILAQLNHSNIATLFGFEEHEGQQFLVMELVEGETLAERIAKGPIPADEAIPLFLQIAQGLEAAHEKSIIHRDLKPANIKISPHHKVKILDFGLAKAYSATDDVSDDLSHSPTLTRGTALGAIVGTAPYMSPEQARGKPVDKRADIWAFGCVFFEALTGRPTFSGDTVSDILASILEREPEWALLTGKATTAATDVIRRCLRKASEKRLRDIGEARIRLEEVSDGPDSLTTAPPDSRRRLAFFLPWVVAVAAVALALFTGVGRDDVQPASPTRLHLNVHNPISTSGNRPLIALSPDGRRLVYYSGGRFFLRDFEGNEEIEISGLTDAYVSFFAPDGESLGFGKEGSSLATLSLNGGLPVAVTAVNDNMGASWGDDGYIYYAEATTAISRVPAAGGEPEVVTDLGPDENAHFFPDVLPGGEALIFTAWTGGGATEATVVVQTLSGERRVEIPRASSGRYTASGHLVYAQAEKLLAVPFDAERLELTGDPVTVVEGVRTDLALGCAQFTVSRNGTLAYLSAVDETRRLVWASPQGEVEPASERSGLYRNPRLSPDGTKLATAIRGAQGSQVWVLDVERGNLSRVTIEGNNGTPVWSPDGNRLVFGSDRDGVYDLYIKSADGAGEARRLTEGDYHRVPTSWVGDTVALIAVNPETGEDVELVSVDAPGETRPIANRPFQESAADLSPDGRWVAYRSEKTGTSEIYLQSLARTDEAAEYQVSVGGGEFPMWSKDGEELLFVGFDDGPQLMMASVLQESPFRVSVPKLLFANDGSLSWGSPLGMRNFDITPDGQRFLMLQRQAPATTTEVHIVLDWFQELERLAPTKN